MPRVEQVQQKALEEFRERNRSTAKRKKTQASRQIGETVVTFVCLFFLLSLLFLQVAKKFTPKIDTSVGNNVETAEPVEAKGTIDDRLKLIQFNDSMAAGELQRQKENEIFNEALDEKVVIPTTKKAQVEETEGNSENLNDKVQKIISKNLTEVKTMTPETPVQPKPAPTAPVVVTPQQQQVTTALVAQTVSKEDLDKRISAIKTADIVLPKATNYKVLVGKYQTAEQAQLAKSILRETELGQNAFVKFIDNSYTIQIGSYSTAEQATSIARQLTTNSFPARVYYEKPTTSTNSDAKTIF